MPDKILIATIFIAIVGVFAGITFYGTQQSQDTEIVQEYESSIESNYQQIIVFETDIEKAKELLFKEYTNHEIVSYEILDTFIVFTIKEVTDND